jgi:hypothetical protein
MSFAGSSPRPAGVVAQGVLKIGDYITLSHLEQGWLSAEGICFDDISLSGELSSFENCLWEVHVQNQYTALKEYEEVLFSTISDDSEMKSSEKDPDRSIVTEELLNQLHRAATNEGHLNKKLMSLKIGKPVLFGDIVQLRHVKSKKFLTVYSGVLAKQERENLRIHLDSYGDVRSWLEIMPKSKGDREGQQISLHSDVLLRVHGRTSEFLHCAKPVGELGIVEVNCSLESSQWSLAPYQDAFSILSSKILAGQVVCLQEVDSSAYLAPVGEDLVERSLSRTPVSLTNSNLIGSSNATVGTHLLWIVEHSTAARGGVIGQLTSSAPTTKITLKHLNTGMYLAMDPAAKSGTQSIYLSSDQSSSQLDLIFSDSHDGLHDGASVQLSREGNWIFTPLQQPQPQQPKNSSLKTTHRANSFMPSLSFEEIDSPTIPHHCSGTSERAKASSFTVRNTLHLRFGPDLFLGVEAAKILRSFVRVGRTHRSQQDQEPHFATQIKAVLAVLELVFQFLSEDLSSSAPFGVSKEDLENFDVIQIIETRQIMMREQGVLSSVVDLIELCGDDVINTLLSQEKCVTPAISKSLSQSKVPVKKLISQNSSSYGRRSPFQSSRRLLSDDERASRSPSKKLLASTVSMEARREISRTISQDKFATRRNPAILRARTSRSNFGNLLSDLDSADQFNESLDEFPGEGMDESHLLKRTLAHDLSTSAFKTLFAIIHDNHSNQMSIADKFPIILNQVKDQELAVACVQEMLRDNIQMLETKVSSTSPHSPSLL